MSDVKPPFSSRHKHRVEEDEEDEEEKERASLGHSIRKVQLQKLRSPPKHQRKQRRHRFSSRA